MAALLTDKKINSLKPGQWATESNARGAGQLQARGLKNKRVAYYFRYTGAHQKQIRIPLGAELALAEARHKAAVLSRQHQEGLPISSLSCKTAAASSQTTFDQVHVKSQTFGTLLLTYVEDLNRRGCISTQEVRNTFQKHIHHAWPQLWQSPITTITTDHLLAIIRTVAEQNKLRAADKLRCYIRAAYAAAIQARQHIDGLPAFIALKISSNPARDIPPLRQSNQTKDRVLSLAELQAYWQHIKNLNTPAGALLRFHLLTGGQRIQQLARATYNDYDPDSQTLTLKDPKGRRYKPRQHVVPILPQTYEAMLIMRGISGIQHTSDCANHNLNDNPLIKNDQSNYIWSVSYGQYGACHSTASKALKQVIEEIRQREATNNKDDNAGESSLADFTLGDIRRTIETLLASKGISRETRAQLQSHGLSGVQVRHYDRHDYLREKKGALEVLYMLMQPDTSSNEAMLPQEPAEPERQKQKIPPPASAKTAFITQNGKKIPVQARRRRTYVQRSP